MQMGLRYEVHLRTKKKVFTSGVLKSECFSQCNWCKCDQDIVFYTSQVARLGFVVHYSLPLDPCGMNLISTMILLFALNCVF